MEPPAALSAPAQFALLIQGLMQAIAARIAEYPWTGEMVLYAWKRVNRINQRFQRLASLIAAGKLPRERFSWPRPPAPGPDPGTRKKPESFGLSWLLSTYRFGWLCRAMPSRPFLPGAGIYTDWLNRLLLDPEMAALLAATPRMRRLLRPLFWMLAVDAPRWRPARATRADVVAATPPMTRAELRDHGHETAEPDDYREAPQPPRPAIASRSRASDDADFAAWRGAEFFAGV